MAYTATDVKNLRERTGAGMMDCKKALDDTGGDMEAAVDALRAKGLAAAAKKSSRTAAEGLVGIAVNGTKGVAVEVNSETDFVAKNDQFQDFVRKTTEVALTQGSDDVEALKNAAYPGGGTVGETLTADPGAWAPDPVELSIEWLRDGLPIAGATGTAYVLVEEDLGAMISVKVTGSKLGYATAAQESDAIGPVGPADEPETLTISGTILDGFTGEPVVGASPACTTGLKK